MVRKWSYLNPTQINDLLSLSSNQGGINSIYTFKVFKATTRFKKFNTGLTLFVRRANAKRRHRSNWITTTYITISWALLFLKNKQFSRFIQTLGIFKNQFFSPTVNYFNLSYSNSSNLEGFNITSCSKNILNFSSQTNVFFKNPITNSPSTVLLSRSDDITMLQNDVNAGFISYDKQVYVDTLGANKVQFFKLYMDTVFHYSFKHIMPLRRVLVLITLLNTLTLEDTNI